MELKYIIDERGNFAIFSKLATHQSMARGFDTHNKIVGAGFCNIAVGYVGKINPDGSEERNINIHCYGSSSSLNIESREEDEKIINHKLNNQDY